MEDEALLILRQEFGNDFEPTDIEGVYKLTEAYDYAKNKNYQISIKQK